MANSKGVEKKCVVCGAGFKVPPSRAETAFSCSHKCSVVYRAEKIKKKVLLTCEHCKGLFEVPRCHVDRRVFCSHKCRNASEKYKARISERVSGENNPMWRGGVVDHKDGYLYQRAADHPFSSNGYVLQHRLVMEEWLRENSPESPYLIALGDALFLSPNCVVHHKDEDKRNNKPENLECMTNGEHIVHHHDKKVEVICKQCGSSYRTKPSTATRTKYCSKSCQIVSWRKENSRGTKS